MRLQRYPIGILTALDRLLNAVLGGDDRLTLSARTWYARARGKLWAKILGGLLDMISAGHCERAAAYDAELTMAYSKAGKLPPMHPGQFIVT